MSLLRVLSHSIEITVTDVTVILPVAEFSEELSLIIARLWEKQTAIYIAARNGRRYDTMTCLLRDLVLVDTVAPSRLVAR